jgi:hypothetical protein
MTTVNLCEGGTTFEPVGIEVIVMSFCGFPVSPLECFKLFTINGHPIGFFVLHLIQQYQIIRIY